MRWLGFPPCVWKTCCTQVLRAMDELPPEGAAEVKEERRPIMGRRRGGSFMLFFFSLSALITGLRVYTTASSFKRSKTTFLLTCLLGSNKGNKSQEDDLPSLYYYIIYVIYALPQS